MPVLPHLRDRFSVLCPDVPGSGWSEFKGAQYDVAGIARQLAPFVEQRLAGPTVVVGHSLGALVAIELAAQRTGGYHKLVLVDPVLFDVERVLTQWSAFVANPRLSLTVLSQLLGVVPSGRISLTLLRSRVLRRVLLADQVGDGAGIDFDILATCLAGTRGWPRFKVSQVLRAARRVRLAERLVAASQTPFTVIRGSEDKLTTTSDLKQLGNFIGLEGIVELEGTGHSPMLDQPRELADAIIDASGCAP